MTLHWDLTIKNVKRFVIILFILVSLVSLIPLSLASEEYTVKFRGVVISEHQSHNSWLNYDEVVEVQITEALMGPVWVPDTHPDSLDIDKYYVYLMEGSSARFDDVQVGDFVEVYGAYPSTQAISGPYNVELTEPQHYLKRIQKEPEEPTPEEPATCDSGPTLTFRCYNNIVQRLYINEDCSEEWRTWKDCSSQNPPCECKYGLCVPIEDDDDPDPGNGGTTCNQQECQSQNKKIGGTYTKNGRLYQRYYECNCADGKCKCESVEREVPCEGTISGHVYDAETRKTIEDADVSCQCGGRWPCYSKTDFLGHYSSYNNICPTDTCIVTCSANEYISKSTMIIANSNGNAENVDFYLQSSQSKPSVKKAIIIEPKRGSKWAPKEKKLNHPPYYDEGTHGDIVEYYLTNMGYEVTHIKGSVEKSDFQNLDDYSVILISSHMDPNYIGLDGYEDENGIDHTTEKISADEISNFYKTPPKDSLVILTGCHSMGDVCDGCERKPRDIVNVPSKLAQAFLGNEGEKAYLVCGYTEYGLDNWTIDSTGELFKKLSEGDSIGQANNYVWNDYVPIWETLNRFYHEPELILYPNDHSDLELI